MEEVGKGFGFPHTSCEKLGRGTPTPSRIPDVFAHALFPLQGCRQFVLSTPSFLA